MRDSALVVSAVIPNWNGRRFLRDCLESLRAQTYPHLEVIVADGASTDGSDRLVTDEYQEFTLLRLPENRGFTGNVNAGLRAARGQALALLNNDAEAEPTWVAELVGGLMAAPDVGSCASKILESTDRTTIASAGDLLGRSGLPAQRGNGQPDDGRFDADRDVFAASGGAAIYRREMLEDVGLLDEGYFMYLEDVDLGLRARLRGWTCRYVPTARVYHRVSATGGGRLASFYVARNAFRLLARGFPTSALGACWPEIVRAQMDRARDAARAWRGAEARATLRGQMAGLLEIPRALHSRRTIQARRRISDRAFLNLLTP